MAGAATGTTGTSSCAVFIAGGGATGGGATGVEGCVSTRRGTRIIVGAVACGWRAITGVCGGGVTARCCVGGGGVTARCCVDGGAVVCTVGGSVGSFCACSSAVAMSPRFGV